MQKIYLLICILFITSLTPAQNAGFNDFRQQEWQQKYQQKYTDAPLHTDNTVDIIYYHLFLNLEIDSSYVKGATVVRFTPVINDLNIITLDLDSAMRADSITGDGRAFAQADNRITIALNHKFNPGDLPEIKIWYHGKPGTLPFMPPSGLTYNTYNGAPMIASFPEPYQSHMFWPCKDGTSDKADSVDVDITLKDTIINGFRMTGISNGVLTGIDSSDKETRTFKWKHRYPIVPYLVLAAASNYHKNTINFTDSCTNFPLTLYALPDKYAKSNSFVTNYFPKVIHNFNRLFGPYPFRKEGYSMTQIFPLYYEAVEMQTNSIIPHIDSTYALVVAHEYAHQWFGDMITCDNWQDVWLNEGFATYAEALTNEFISGKQNYMSFLLSCQYFDGGSIYLEDDNYPYAIFSDIVYNKGAWVLHMLRGVLGDSTFFECMKTYATSSSLVYKHATTDNFKNTCESVSGRDLTTFFDQWIYKTYFPYYAYDFQNNPFDNSCTLILNQHQNDTSFNTGANPVFEMPVEIRFKPANHADTIVRVFNNQQTQSYTFNFGYPVVSVEIDPDNRILHKSIRIKGLQAGVSTVFAVNDFSIYPNPSSGIFTVELNTDVPKNTSLKIADLQGREIYNTHLNSNGKFSFNLGNYAPGLYFVTLQNESGIVVKKISHY